MRRSRWIALLAALVIVVSCVCVGVHMVGAATAGDVNRDGSIDNKDLTRMMRYLAGEAVEVDMAAMDANGDGQINTKDLTRMQRYLAGLVDLAEIETDTTPTDTETETDTEAVETPDYVLNTASKKIHLPTCGLAANISAANYGAHNGSVSGLLADGYTTCGRCLAGFEPEPDNAIPPYAGEPYVVLNGGIPVFSEDELTTVAYELYATLDDLGRCGVALATCGTEIMPAEGEERGSISHISPTGWVQAQYDCVSGKYLYNRAHLIGWQLSAENANRQNLITGTRYMNVEGMLPFENMVADYIRETGNHVAYRVTPLFEGDNLLCSGVQMEAYSIEDMGEGICFNVYCYNIQPGVLIDYATGQSQLEDGDVTESETETEVETEVSTEVETESGQESVTYVLNTSTKKAHMPTCSYATSMTEANRGEYTGNLEELLAEGYTACSRCIQ